MKISVFYFNRETSRVGTHRKGLCAFLLILQPRLGRNYGFPLAMPFFTCPVLPFPFLLSLCGHTLSFKCLVSCWCILPIQGIELLVQGQKRSETTRLETCSLPFGEVVQPKPAGGHSSSVWASLWEVCWRAEESQFSVKSEDVVTKAVTGRTR